MEGVNDGVSSRSSVQWGLSFSWASGLRRPGPRVVEYCAFPDGWGDGVEMSLTDTWGEFGLPETWPACIATALSALPQAICCAGCGALQTNPKPISHVFISGCLSKG